MITVKAAAIHASVSESIIRAWVASGLLVHYRLGAPGKRGKIAIKLEDLEAFLAGRRVENTPPAPKVKKPKVAFRHLKVS
jgi:hypothetical protein